MIPGALLGYIRSIRSLIGVINHKTRKTTKFACAALSSTVTQCSPPPQGALVVVSVLPVDASSTSRRLFTPSGKHPAAPRSIRSESGPSSAMAPPQFRIETTAPAELASSTVSIPTAGVTPAELVAADAANESHKEVSAGADTLGWSSGGGNAR